MWSLRAATSLRNAVSCPAGRAPARPVVRRSGAACRAAPGPVSPHGKRGWGDIMSDLGTLLRTFADSLLGRTVIRYLLIFTVPFLAPLAFITLIGFRGLRHLLSY